MRRILLTNSIFNARACKRIWLASCSDRSSAGWSAAIGTQCVEEVVVAGCGAGKARLILCLAAVLFLAAVAHGQTTLGTQTLNLTLNQAAFLYSVPSSISLTQSGNVFNNYTGSVTITYRARTSSGGSGGSLTVKATADFTPAGGPSIASPPTAGDKLTYTCSGTSGNGFTPCSSAQTVSTTTATNVVTVGTSACTGSGDSCSGADPDTVTTSFTLTNDPKYKTGAYQATLTWTISAT